MKKLIHFIFSIILFINFLTSGVHSAPYDGNGVRPDFSCNITSMDPGAPNEFDKVIKRITIDSKENNISQLPSHPPNNKVWAWISRNSSELGLVIGENVVIPIGKDYLVSDGQFSIEELQNDGEVLRGEGERFEPGRYYITITSDENNRPNVYCQVSFEVTQGLRSNQCSVLAGNKQGTLTPNTNLFVYAPDLTRLGGAYTNLDKEMEVIVAYDSEQKKVVEPTYPKKQIRDLIQGIEADGNRGADMGTSYRLPPARYHVFVRDPEAFAERDVCIGAVDVLIEGGGTPGLATCPVCLPPAKMVDGTCQGGTEGSNTIQAECLAPWVCKPDGTGCRLERNSLQSIYDSGNPYVFNPCAQGYDSGNCPNVKTGIAGLTLGTSAPEIGKGLLGLLITIGGAVAFIIIIITGYRLMTSQGDPEKIKAAREQLTSAIVGLLFIIFSISILSFLGYEVLRIPGIGP